MERRVDMELAHHRLAPSRSEINCKVCISFTASVVISTFACTLVVLHLQSTVSPVKEATGYQKLQGERTQNTQRMPRPNAHLVAVCSDVDGVLSWQNSSKEDLNMEYNDSERSLVIPKKGFYIIYLQISYRFTENFICKGDNVVLIHEVIKRSLLRYSYTKPKNVISSLETVSCTEKYWGRTTHSMARIFFRKEDRLQVKLSSNWSLVDIYGPHGTKTFWGVYLDRDLK
ncbi:tumor necrosis factor-like isoform X1 [Alosa pseudoharengus]|uniref:tumor necrosis factor-like isoform X1 n=1 Tax=Alosa pseudoharengus TaxID=34774 RepID=UPI003F88A388